MATVIKSYTQELNITIDKRESAIMLESIINAESTAELAIVHDMNTSQFLCKRGLVESTQQTAIGAENRRRNAAKLAQLLGKTQGD